VNESAEHVATAVEDQAATGHETASSEQHASGLPAEQDAAGLSTEQDAAALSTGDRTVDQALARLGELDSRDLAQHAEVYDDIHDSFRAALDAAGDLGRPEAPDDADR
jgi:hypothetical protein